MAAEHDRQTLGDQNRMEVLAGLRQMVLAVVEIRDRILAVVRQNQKLGPAAAKNPGDLRDRRWRQIHRVDIRW